MGIRNGVGTAFAYACLKSFSGGESGLQVAGACSWSTAESGFLAAYGTAVIIWPPVKQKLTSTKSKARKWFHHPETIATGFFEKKNHLPEFRIGGFLSVRIIKARK